MMQTTTPAEAKVIIIAYPFQGYAQSIIKPDGSVAHTPCKSFEEYQQAKPELDLQLISSREFDIMHEAFYESPFEEITPEVYEEMLCQLPPLKWHNLSAELNVFFCSEAMSGQFHSCYIYNRNTQKYYAGMKNEFTADEQLIKEFYEETKEQANDSNVLISV